MSVTLIKINLGFLLITHLIVTYIKFTSNFLLLKMRSGKLFSDTSLKSLLSDWLKAKSFSKLTNKKSEFQDWSLKKKVEH